MFGAAAHSPSNEVSTLTAFTADASSALAGPRWLAARRAAAWERFAAGSLPHEAEEVWRYSGIDGFDLDAFAPARSHRAAASPLETRSGPGRTLRTRAALVVTYNGVIVGVERAPVVPDDQLSVASVLSGDGAPPGLGGLAPAHDAFGELHDAFLADVVHVVVARKVVLSDPVVVVHLVDRGDLSGSRSAFPRTLVEVGTSAEAGVIELTASLGADAGAGLVGDGGAGAASAVAASRCS